MKKYIFLTLFLFSFSSIYAQDLFSAARENNVKQIEELISNGKHVDEANQRGFTPLILAIYNNSSDVAKVLLSKGANPNAQDLSGNNALMGAAFRGFPEMANLLIMNKADVNQVNFLIWYPPKF